MAGKRAVAATLAVLSRVFAGVVDEAKIAVYHGAWLDLTDEDLEEAVTLVVRTWTGAFIPPPAVLRAAIAPAPVAVDGGRILRQIEKLSVYNANTGMIPPSVETVRDSMGEMVAYAYAAAGGRRVFSDNETTRDIASREFEKALTEAARRPDAQLPMIGAGHAAGRIGPSKVRALISDTAAGMSIERTRRDGAIGTGERDAAD